MILKCINDRLLLLGIHSIKSKIVTDIEIYLINHILPVKKMLNQPKIFKAWKKKLLNQPKVFKASSNIS